MSVYQDHVCQAFDRVLTSEDQQVETSLEKTWLGIFNGDLEHACYLYKPQGSYILLVPGAD
jgi:hypothetical protein